MYIRYGYKLYCKIVVSPLHFYNSRGRKSIFLDRDECALVEDGACTPLENVVKRASKFLQSPSYSFL